MYTENIKKLTKENTNFRKVLHTGVHSQIVAMCIPVHGDIGMESHQNTDQILVFVDGDGRAIINNEECSVSENSVVFVPAGAVHNFINTGEKALKLFTVYAPPEHKEGTINATKEDAEKEERK